MPYCFDFPFLLKFGFKLVLLKKKIIRTGIHVSLVLNLPCCLGNKLTPVCLPHELNDGSVAYDRFQVCEFSNLKEKKI